MDGHSTSRNSRRNCDNHSDNVGLVMTERPEERSRPTLTGGTGRANERASSSGEKGGKRGGAHA